MKQLVVLALLVIAINSQAQQLKFNVDKTFKLVQFTDIHYVANKEASKMSLKMINETLDAEKPNLVVFTGDIVVGAPTAQGWDEILETVISRKIPYLITFGNHDDESEWKRNQVAEYVINKPFLLNNNPQLNAVDGYLNSSVSIVDTENNAAAIIYAMDSQAYSKNSKVKGYGWFASNQVEWFRKESQKYKEAKGDTLPALAFFHIPLPEYAMAFNDMKNKRVGVRYEVECAPFINTGMFAAMLESGDVMGTFVGHDHVNDYLVDYYGIALAYGCFSGSANTYQRSKNGARVIKLYENQRKFETYIREYDGTLVYPISFPFVQKK